MAKKLLGYFVGISIVLFLAVMAAGSMIKRASGGRIAPGIQLFGQDFSGMSREEAEKAAAESVPEIRLELICRILPEMCREEEEKMQQAGYGMGNGTAVRVTGNEWHLTVKAPMIKVLTDETMARLTARSNEVKAWEWLYMAIMKRPFCIRQAEAEFAWEEEYFSELLSICAGMLEREKREAEIVWENGEISVKESRTGFRLETGKAVTEAEKVFAQVIERLKQAPADGLVVRIFLDGTAVMPNLSTAQAKRCDTKIAEFTTSYQGARSGKVQNIAVGAEHLNTWVVLPREEFSTAAALMPFTEENGYTAGGTYIDGVLSESIGGGVCQLSTTLYNALLRTRLEITERYAHSVPVSYIAPGQDAAIAENYKDLKFKNTTNAPVLLLCEATGEEINITLYGTAEAARPNVTMESIVVEEKEDGITVEVYRLEQKEGGELLREYVGKSQYRYPKKEEEIGVN